MRPAALVLSFALLTACAPKDEAPAAGDAAVQTPAAPTAATIADFAGNYQVTAILGKDTVPSTMMVTADGVGSTLSLTGRPNIALMLSMSGDSLVAQSAEYESVLRKGTMVSNRTAVAKAADGSLAGTVSATYKVRGGDQVVNGTIRATKMP